MKDDPFRVRTMSPKEVALAVDWAAAEGWNPGLSDAACFATAAPDGFLLGELAGAPAAILSVANYDERFSFLGFYIVRQDLRGRGLGLRIWQVGMARAGSRAIGLDGVSGATGQLSRIRLRVCLQQHPLWRLGGARRRGHAYHRVIERSVPRLDRTRRRHGVSNRAAVALATAHGLAAVFETARMYSGLIRSVSLERVYGVTTFELG